MSKPRTGIQNWIQIYSAEELNAHRPDSERDSLAWIHFIYHEFKKSNVCNLVLFSFSYSYADQQRK